MVLFVGGLEVEVVVVVVGVVVKGGMVLFVGDLEAEAAVVVGGVVMVFCVAGYGEEFSSRISLLGCIFVVVLTTLPKFTFDLRGLDVFRFGDSAYFVVVWKSGDLYT